MENYNGKINYNNSNKGEQTMTKEQLKQVDEMTTKIVLHLDDMLTKEDCKHYIKLTKENATVFFTALNNAACLTLSRFANECTNFLESQHMFNKLLIKYLIDCNESENN